MNLNFETDGINFNAVKPDEIATPQHICDDMSNLFDYTDCNKKIWMDMYCKTGNTLVALKKQGINKENMIAICGNKQSQMLICRKLYGKILPEIEVVITIKSLEDFKVTRRGQVYWVSDWKENVKENFQDAYNVIKFVIMKEMENTMSLGWTTEENFKINNIIMNPPYNSDMYIDFVTLAHKIASDSVVAITPAKWQTKSGAKNEQFRRDIVPYMSKIVYYPNCSDVFLIGEQSGIAYYIFDKKVCNTKEIENRSIAQPLYNNKLHREIGLTLNNAIYSIHKHIQNIQGYKAFKWVDTGTNHKYSLAINNKVNNERGVAGQYQAYGTISYATGKSNVICAPFILEDIIESIDLTNADKVIFSSDNRYVCDSMKSWLNTKFVRFFIYGRLCGISPVISDFTFAMVPAPEAFDHIFTDQELYEKYNLTDEEINIIESVIKER